MKLKKIFGASIIMTALIFSSFDMVRAETVQKKVEPQAGATNVEALIKKAITFYYKNFYAGKDVPCTDNFTTCKFDQEPHNINHDLRVKVKGQTEEMNKQEVMLQHIGEDILTNQTSDKPEIRYTSTYNISTTKSTSTTVNKGFILPEKIGNILVAAEVIGIGKIDLPFDFNKTKTVTDSVTESTSTSPQAYKVKPNQVIKVITELYATTYDGTVGFTADPVSNNNINVEFTIKGGVCRGVPGGTICLKSKERKFNGNFTAIYDGLNSSQKQDLENSGMYINTDVAWPYKTPYFKGKGSFEGIGGHRVITKDYDITDPKNPKLLSVRSQDI